MKPSRIAAGLSVCVALSAGCGGDDRKPGSPRDPIVWDVPPRVLEAPGPEQARIVQGVIRNRSEEPVELRARGLELRQSDGDPVDGTAIFLSGYVRPGESQNRGPAELSRQEEERLGRVVRMEPGRTAPLVVSWRTRAGRPALIAYPGGTLELSAP